MPLTLTHAKYAVTLPDPLRSYERQSEKRQSDGYDSTGAPFIYSKGGTNPLRHRLQFRISRFEFEELRYFFESVADGMANGFTLSDTSGLLTTQTVRFTGSSLAAELNKDGSTYTTNLTLEAEA